MSASLLREEDMEKLEKETIRKVAWRLMPLLMLGFFCAWLDRSNVGMAAPTMRTDLGFSNAIFGFGAGVFFLGYFIAEIPSNLLMARYGARVWFARILITWGLISGLTAFVWSSASFYGVRFLLGMAEAGFYPGVVLYLTWWFPSAYRTRMMAIFSTCFALSLVVGMPLSGLILQLEGALGLHGWQWLYVVETIPPVVMCVVMYRLLTDSPDKASWLSHEQRAWLTERIASEKVQREAVHKFSFWQAMTNPKVWALTVTYFLLMGSNYGLAFFMPMIVRDVGVSASWLGIVSAIPYLFALPGQLFWGWHSDITGDRTWHVVGSCIVCACGMASCALIGGGNPYLMMVALVVGVVGQSSITPVFWSIPSALLTGTAAAGGLALINSVGNLGGWLGPFVYGLIKDATSSDNLALLSLSVAPVVAACIIVGVGHDRRLERIVPRHRS